MHSQDTCTNALTVPVYGRLEAVLSHNGAYDNPYVDLTAVAHLAAPGGEGTLRVPLFWDGGRTWRLRFSPHRAGRWTWTVRSDDVGLDGCSGSFEAAQAGWRGGIQPMAGYPYHFQRQNGEPLLFMGDTAWALYTDSQEEGHDRAAVEHYVDVRASQGFNAIHAMLISESGWGNCGGDAFLDLNAERINPAYWQEVDRRLAYLNCRGITGGLVLAWGDKGRNPNNWRDFPAQEGRLRYARYVAARYGAYDVYWIVAGEWTADTRLAKGPSEAQIRAEYAQIGQALQDSDPHGRMIAIHPMIVGTVREFAAQGWMGFGDYQQMYHDLHVEALASRRFDKPVVNAEYAYYLRDQNADGVVDKDNSYNLDTIRHATWDIAMAGGYFISGFGNTYFGGHRNPGPFDVDAPQDDAWEAQVGHVRRLFTGLDWWRLEPRDDLVAASVPRGQDRRVVLEDGKRPLLAPPVTAYWALAEEGRQYVVYVRGVSGSVTLSLADEEQTVRLRQFDPRRGETQDLGIRQVQRQLDYAPPDVRDWVLVVRVEPGSRRDAAGFGVAHNADGWGFGL